MRYLEKFVQRDFTIFFCCRKKVIIHVPYRVKKVKHTHTIYKIIPHHEAKHREDNDDIVYYDDEEHR